MSAPTLSKELAVHARQVANSMWFAGTLTTNLNRTAVETLRACADALDAQPEAVVKGGLAVHPNHRPDLRYILALLERLKPLADYGRVGTRDAELARLQGDIAAAINGMNYILKRTEEAATSPPAPQPERVALTQREVERLVYQSPIFTAAILALNGVKAWRDCDGNDGFPGEVRELVEAVLVGYEARAHGIGTPSTGKGQ